MNRKQAIESLGPQMPESLIVSHMVMCACLECMDTRRRASMAPLGAYAGGFFEDRKQHAARKPGYLFASNV